MLTSVTALPAGRHYPARHSAAEVPRSDSTWAPVIVLAWHQLDEPRIQALTEREIGWLVQLRLADGAEGWYEFVARTSDGDEGQRNLRVGRFWRLHPAAEGTTDSSTPGRKGEAVKRLRPVRFRS
jgi:hypothetical protein